MSHTNEYDIGSDVSCSDGPCGELKRVVVDPVAVAITHLVVEPKHRPGMGRLVPIGLVASAAGGLQLSCTQAQFRALDDAEEVQFLPGASGLWGYGQDQVLSLPYYGLPGVGMGGMDMDMGAGPRAVMSDRIPVGEVGVRRGAHVEATDGQIGRVQGLIVDSDDHHVTHVLLEEGHLWGEKRVAIPIGAVSGVDVGVRLSLNKDEVRDLPAVDLSNPA